MKFSEHDLTPVVKNIVQNLGFCFQILSFLLLTLLVHASRKICQLSLSVSLLQMGLSDILQKKVQQCVWVIWCCNQNFATDEVLACDCSSHLSLCMNALDYWLSIHTFTSLVLWYPTIVDGSGRVRVNIFYSSGLSHTYKDALSPPPQPTNRKK